MLLQGTGVTQAIYLFFFDRLYDFMKYKARNKVIFDNDDYSQQTPKNLFIETTESPPIGGESCSLLCTEINQIF